MVFLFLSIDLFTPQENILNINTNTVYAKSSGGFSHSSSSKSSGGSFKSGSFSSPKFELCKNFSQF